MNDQSIGRNWRGRIDPAGSDGDRMDARTDGEANAGASLPTGAGASGGGAGRQGRRPASGDGARTPRRSDALAPRDTQGVADRRESYLPEAYLAPAAFGAGDSGGDDLNLRKYVALLLKHRWIILGSVAVFLCLGLGVTLLTTPIYRASTTLQIDREVDDVVNGQAVQATDTDSAEFYQTQYELLKSRSLAERVVANLSLQDDAAFNASHGGSILGRIRSLVFGSGDTSDANSSDAVAARQSAAAGRLVGGVTVEPVRNSSIVKLSFDSANAAEAAKVVNAVADNYISLNLERRYDASSYARSFLEDQLADLKAKLADSQQQVVAYAADQNIEDTGGGVTLAQTDLSTANSSYTQAVSDRMKAELVWDEVQPDGPVPEFLETPTLTDLKTKQADLQADYRDKLSLFKPAYPDMVKEQGQIDDLSKQIAAETANIKASIKAKYDQALATEKSFSDQVTQLTASLNDFLNKNIQYTILQREVDTNQQLYDGLLERYKEIGVAGGVGVNNISVVDKAQVPGGPYSPNMTRNLAIALMLGALFGVGGAFAREQFDDTFKSPEDIEGNLGLPLLGMIPKMGSTDDHALALADPRSALGEAYRSLRTALQFSTTTGVPRTLLTTSSRPSEGKSTTAATVARNFAALGMKVLVVDADLRKPTLHTLFGKDNGIGLSNCLTGTAVPADAFQRTDVAGLTLLASGPLPPNPAELIAGPRMLSLLTVAAETYDMVIIDGPPVSGLADSPLLASLADGTLMVIDPGTTRRGMVKAAIKRLAFARAQMVGIVVNKVDMSSSGYGYGYGYGAYGYGDNYYGYGHEQQQVGKAGMRGLVSRLTGR